MLNLTRACVTPMLPGATLCCALIESGGGTGPLKPRQPAPVARCQLRRDEDRTVKQNPFLQRITTGTLVADGAIGTQLYERGVAYGTSFAGVNLGNPTLVSAIHCDYL